MAPLCCGEPSQGDMLTVVINIRGTNGSGKSTTVRRILNSFAFTEVKHGRVTCYEYESNAHGPFKIAVIGAYKTATGGCDTIKTQDEVCDLVRVYASQGWHVIFEGVVISTLHSRYSKLADELLAGYNTPTVFAYMDTPPERCLQNVKARRVAAGRPETGFNEQMVLDKYVTIKKTAAKMGDDGHRVHVLHFGASHHDILNLLAG